MNVKPSLATGFRLENLLRGVWAKLEFERLWEGDIQGYCSVHVRKQIPTGGQDSRKGMVNTLPPE